MKQRSRDRERGMSTFPKPSFLHSDQTLVGAAISCLAIVPRHSVNKESDSHRKVDENGDTWFEVQR